MQLGVLMLFTRPCGHNCLIIPIPAAGDALSAYNLLRAFSWLVRLSPFPFEDLLAALAMPTPTPLMDELHVSVMQAPDLFVGPIMLPAECTAWVVAGVSCLNISLAEHDLRAVGQTIAEDMWPDSGPFGRQLMQTFGLIAGSLVKSVLLGSHRAILLSTWEPDTED